MPSSKHLREATQVPRTAAWLGATGLIPFVTASLALWTLPSHDAALITPLLLTYAAIILSFMGAVHWGLAMAAGAGTARWFVSSVVPALVGWCALMLAPRAACALFAIAFVAVYGLDHVAIAAGRAPAWYRRLRMPLTVVVVTSLAASGFAL
jgi:hypothetical protein